MSASLKKRLKRCGRTYSSINNSATKRQCTTWNSYTDSTCISKSVNTHCEIIEHEEGITECLPQGSADGRLEIGGPTRESLVNGGLDVESSTKKPNEQECDNITKDKLCAHYKDEDRNINEVQKTRTLETGLLSINGENLADLKKDKRRFLQSVTDKKEYVRKLKMIKMYRSKVSKILQMSLFHLENKRCTVKCS